MKTIEEVNGQKVWAVDAIHGCDGCIFTGKIKCINMPCIPVLRTDNQNVIFQLYEKEKTFTLSQINKVIDELIKSESYSHSISFSDRLDTLNKLKQKLEQL